VLSGDAWGLRSARGAAQGQVQKRIACRIISLVIAVCWRRISAVQNARAAPAQLLAALSQRLNQGLGIGAPFCRA
jgi:hypothetical protein